MARGSFIMRPTKSYVGRYLMLIFFPPPLFIVLYQLLVEYKIFSANYIATRVIIDLALGYLLVSVCYFLAKKQRTIEIRNHEIIVKRFSGSTITKVKVKQIQYVRRNLLDELVLFGENGKFLLAVCPHLENRFLFEDWLLDHDIRLKNKSRRKLTNHRLKEK